MRIKKIIDALKKKWIYLVYLFLSLFFLYAGLVNLQIHPLLIFFNILILGVFTFLYEFKKEESLGEYNITKKDFQEQTDYVKEIHESKETSLNLLNNLLNNGLIDDEEVFEHLPNSDIYCLICFPTTMKKLITGNKEYTFVTRQYPDFLKSIGFVRTNRFSPAFVTTPRRLTKTFRNIPALKNYILEQVDPILESEWKLYLKEMKKKRGFKKYWREYKKQDYKDHLLFSLAIIRGKLDERNVGYLFGKKTYSKDFEDLLKEEVDFKHIDLPRQKKVRIKEFISDSSIELFFYGVNKKVLDQIKALESKLKEELNITKFPDYLKNSEEDIAKIFNTKFTKKDSLNYAKLLKKRIKEYDSALRDLKISI